MVFTTGWRVLLAKDSVEHPRMHRTDPHNNKLSTPEVSRASVENPGGRQTSHASVCTQAGTRRAHPAEPRTDGCSVSRRKPLGWAQQGEVSALAETSRRRLTSPKPAVLPDPTVSQCSCPPLPTPRHSSLKPWNWNQKIPELRQEFPSLATG